MPIVRIDNDGNDIEKLIQEKKEAQESIDKTRREIQKKRHLALSKTIIAVTYAAASATFFLYSENLGIFLATVPATVLSFLNLRAS